MTKWEYIVERFTPNSHLTLDTHKLRNWLNGYGSKGWEVVEMGRDENCYMVTFKRPKKLRRTRLQSL